MRRENQCEKQKTILSMRSWEASEVDLVSSEWCIVRSIILRHVLELKINKAKISLRKLRRDSHKRHQQTVVFRLTNFSASRTGKNIFVNAELKCHESISLRNICIKSGSFRNKNTMDPGGSLICNQILICVFVVIKKGIKWFKVPPGLDCYDDEWFKGKRESDDCLMVLNVMGDGGT